MGVKIVSQQNCSGTDMPDPGAFNLENVPGPSSIGATLACKVSEKQQNLRRKGMEKSVLDDIMGDPDDFRDLGDSDAESDGGRWEDTIREAQEEAAVVEGAALTENIELEQQVNSEMEPEIFSRKDELQPSPSWIDKTHEPVSSQGLEPASQTNSGHDLADDKERSDDKEKSNCTPDVGTNNGSTNPGKVQRIRYFIIKSLNHHNIAKSIERKIWATQAMNEPVLNEAFETSEKVILVFSVNMSGHFQGYAQMTSPIGRRRANVWSEANSGANPWGGTFTVEWLRLYDLPFQKTVHLKNPLNSYKPVKISRDGQELTQEIGEALCALIDEGADKEGKPKRKVGPGDLALTKRPRGEKPTLPLGGSYRNQIPPVPIKGPVAPITYSAVQFPPALLHEPYNPQTPMIRPPGGMSSATLSISEQPRNAKSRSPRHVLSEKNLDRERDRDKGQHEGGYRVTGREEQSRAGSKNRNTDLQPDDDFLNMTYEEYLQRHGKTKEYNGYHQGASGVSSYQSAPIYGSGWMGSGGSGICYSDDQYSNYLANWYSSQQASMVSNEGFFSAQGMPKPYPSNYPP